MRKIIISGVDSGGRTQYVFWADVPSERQKFYAQQNQKSNFKDASAEELQALQNGVVVEKTDTLQKDISDVAIIKSTLIELFNAFQAEINSYNKWKKYGSSWDGKEWQDLSIN